MFSYTYTTIHCREKFSGEEKFGSDGSENSHTSGGQYLVCESSSDHPQINTGEQNVGQNQPGDCEQMVTEDKESKLYIGYCISIALIIVTQ